MSRDQAELDFGLVEPTAVFGCVVYFQTAPEVAAFLAAEAIGEGLAAMNIEIVHHQVDLTGKGIVGDQTLDHSGELSRGAVGGGAGKMPPGLRFHNSEDVGGPPALVFVCLLYTSDAADE